MLRVAGIRKSFPGVVALDGVDLEVSPGEVHALVGENGAGKSTLVKILGGGLRPEQGEVLLGGARLPLGDPARARRAGIGVIYQELTLVPELGVDENIFLGRERRRAGLLLERRRMEAEARAILAELGVALDPRARVASLSVGMRQLVEVARALATGNRLLVFDEPSAALTPAELHRLAAVIARLRERRHAVIYISHRLEEVFDLADRVTVLRDGRRVATAAVTEVDRARLIRWMVGRELDEASAPAPRAPGSPLLEVRGLSVPGRLDGVSLTLRRGEILGVAGLVGAGRTTLGLALAGALPAARGEVLLEGRPALARHPWEALRRGIGYLTEDRKQSGIFPGASIAENIVMAHLGALRRGGLLTQRRFVEAARGVCERLAIKSGGLERQIRTLSGGNQQKALLGRLLVRPPRVLVLDEPTRGIDVGARQEVHRIVEQLAAEGVGVLLISSDLPELLAVADRILVLAGGRARGVLPHSAATQERILELATPKARS